MFRMAKAGADIVGANCLFDPWIGLETVRKIKITLKARNCNFTLTNLTSAEEDEGCIGRLQHVPPLDDPAQRLPLPGLWTFRMAFLARVSLR